MIRSLNPPPPSAAPGANPATAVERLLREILVCLDSIPKGVSAEPGAPGQSNPVVLDIQVDGFAYKLLREEMSSPSQRQVLSPREQEIVRLVAKGLPSKAIADVLDMSTWTVGSHLRRVFAKLGVSTRAEMVAQVLEGKLLDE